MDELEEHRELDRLIEEQESDDTYAVYHDEPGHRDDISLQGLDNSLAVDEDGELIDMTPRERGTVLVGSAAWHGTRAGYTKKGCRCERCTAANTEYIRAYRERKPQEAAS